ncbi:unnamed protein product [Arctogadus glacialis]
MRSFPSGFVRGILGAHDVSVIVVVLAEGREPQPGVADQPPPPGGGTFGPPNLDVALELAERAERELSDLQPSGASRPHVRQADYERDEDEDDEEECFQAWTSPQRPRQRPPQRPPPDDRRKSRADRRCFRCDEPGHLSRDCPAPAQRARPSRPVENGGGEGQESSQIPAPLHGRCALVGLAVRVGDREVMHEFWLAVIRDSCIIGLDLLNRWGARVDMAGATITVGTVALQSGRGEQLLLEEYGDIF